MAAHRAADQSKATKHHAQLDGSGTPEEATIDGGIGLTPPIVRRILFRWRFESVNEVGVTSWNASA